MTINEFCHKNVGNLYRVDVIAQQSIVNLLFKLVLDNVPQFCFLTVPDCTLQYFHSIVTQQRPDHLHHQFNIKLTLTEAQAPMSRITSSTTDLMPP